MTTTTPEHDPEQIRWKAYGVAVDVLNGWMRFPGLTRFSIQSEAELAAGRGTAQYLLGVIARGEEVPQIAEFTIRESSHTRAGLRRLGK